MSKLPPELKTLAKSIEVLATKAQACREEKERMSAAAKAYRQQLISETQYAQVFQGKGYSEAVTQLNARLTENLRQMLGTLQRIEEALNVPPPPSVPEAAPAGALRMDKKAFKQALHDLDLDEPTLRELFPGKRERSLLEKEYTLYKPSSYGKLANRFMEPLTLSMTKQYPDFFASLRQALLTSDLKILSKSYISILFFSTLLTFLALPLIFLALLSTPWIIRVPQALILSLLGTAGMFTFIYYYPALNATAKKTRIHNDLPFTIIHMAAVAGSGAQPISMFYLLLSSGEYRGIESEIKKIVNYVNLFGYDLSTALRAVAARPPSNDFRELLLGMVTTIESGGSLKEYLKLKAEDSMDKYQLERKKYVETIATYSDIYIGVGIAAPLLFFVTLSIIQGLGGAIFGLTASSIANTGTFVIIPLLNIVFIIMINIIQPEV